MSEDWDIEKYKNMFEPEEQWELKKKFMETHKGLFSEERVVCLAQVLVNVEFLGTKYPDETMRTVAELSKDIIGEFRERQKTRLQRTFVGAADAANAKYQGKSIPKSNTLSHHKETVPSQLQPPEEGKRKTAPEREDNTAAVIEKKRKKVKVCANKNNDAKERLDSCGIFSQSLGSITGRKNSPYTNPKLVLTFLHSELTKPLFPYGNVIRDSTRLANIKLETPAELDKATNRWLSSIVFDGIVIASATGEYKASLRSAFEIAFQQLKARHYQLIIKDPEAMSVFNVLNEVQDELEMMERGLKKDTISKNVIDQSDMKSPPSPAAEAEQSSVAMKMMKMMGWTAGSGLGAKNQGIVEPIQADVVIGRSGLGSETGREFKSTIRAKLQEYVKSNALYKLTFTSEFSPEERSVIHELARTMGLKTKSAGSKSNRVLTVRRQGSAGTPEVYPIVEKLKELKSAHPLYSRAQLIPPTDL